jgi:hypothetical protein
MSGSWPKTGEAAMKILRDLQRDNEMERAIRQKLLSKRRTGILLTVEELHWMDQHPVRAKALLKARDRASKR